MSGNGSLYDRAAQQQRNTGGQGELPTARCRDPMALRVQTEDQGQQADEGAEDLQRLSEDDAHGAHSGGEVRGRAGLGNRSLHPLRRLVGETRRPGTRPVLRFEFGDVDPRLSAENADACGRRAV